MNGCPRYAYDPKKQKEVYEEYKTYLSSVSLNLVKSMIAFMHSLLNYIFFLLQYTPEEIEWYGLSWYEALSKVAKIKEAANKPVPLKSLYRKNLVEKLKAAEIETKNTSTDEIS